MLYNTLVNYTDNTINMHPKEDSLSVFFWKKNLFSSSGVVEDPVCAGVQDIEIKENVPSHRRAHSLASPMDVSVHRKAVNYSLVKVGDQLKSLFVAFQDFSRN